MTLPPNEDGLLNRDQKNQRVKFGGDIQKFDVCFTPKNRHFEGSCKESVNYPKRTLTGVRRRYVWRNIFKIDEAQFTIAAGRIALYASHL
jgi:hypothetical protein